MATIEELVGRSVEELEKMSDDELTKELQHYFIVTRPAPFKQKRSLEGTPVKKPSTNPKGAALLKAIQIGKKHGVDLTTLLKTKKK